MSSNKHKDVEMAQEKTIDLKTPALLEKSLPFPSGFERHNDIPMEVNSKTDKEVEKLENQGESLESVGDESENEHDKMANQKKRC